MKYKECLKVNKAVKLLINYYKYFANLDGVGTYISMDRQWDRAGQRTVPDSYFTKIYVYKSTAKNQKRQKLKTLLELHPDMHCEIEEDKYNWVFKVSSIDLSLPSIKNNDLGFERNVE